MTKFIMTAAASALVLASASASLAGNPVAPAADVAPDVFAAGSSSSAPLILGAVAAVAVLAALADSDSDSASTTD